ncbi:succinate dehydrogenase, cytochrome b556 subunit [Brevundimonas halotolerans]|uniref:Succinate dehydrogenase cytochrome b556 subunit n=1 Tax=Brevundimonas halotolerans TaxID=69670 RepID=A0A7W9A3X1_9CAUL|nr:succinate dehydrogenase, cytochrome b556 subunit [Brevundimonas halotolerans]MBB5660720.1 succinate dehydrogenase / fumarate reductase cytochrome b subunit [Brevundimonas halotolerans]
MSEPLSGSPADQAGPPQFYTPQPNGRVRPTSPHLQIWRWHVTMLGSILHRITGSGLAGGVVLVALWLGALAFGPEAYETFVGLAGSPLGLIVWFALSLAGFYHLASGVRHLIWDTGAGLSPKGASTLTTITLVFAVVATLTFWGWLFASGKVTL